MEFVSNKALFYKTIQTFAAWIKTSLLLPVSHITNPASSPRDCASNAQIFSVGGSRWWLKNHVLAPSQADGVVDSWLSLAKHCRSRHLGREQEFVRFSLSLFALSLSCSFSYILSFCLTNKQSNNNKKKEYIRKFVESLHGLTKSFLFNFSLLNKTMYALVEISISYVSQN